MRRCFGRTALSTGALVACIVTSAHAAATIAVNTRADVVSSTDGVCSLREAVVAVNTTSPSGSVAGECPAGDPVGATIVLAGGPSYVLTAGALHIGHALTIAGAGAASTTIDGGGTSRVLDVGAAPGVAIDAVTITGGRAPAGAAMPAATAGDGGAIRSGGTLTLTDVIVSNSQAGAGASGTGSMGPIDGGPGGSGGAIDNTGVLTLIRTTVTGNAAGAGGAGTAGTTSHGGGPGGMAGGIENAAGGTLTMTDSTLIGNHAGAGGQGSAAGIATNGGTGGDGGSGGGLRDDGTMSISRSAITANGAGHGGAGGGNGGSTTLTGGPGGSGGLGGGIYDASSTAQLIDDSTIAANAAGGGGDGGVASYGGQGGGGGGVVSAGAVLKLTNDTVSSNQVGAGGGDGGGGPGGIGGGGGINAFGAAEAQNTLVAGNGGGNCLGAIVDDGHNLSYPDKTCPGINADPMIGPPHDNGGPTLTVALGAGSAAVDQVPATGAGCPAVDQRGIARPQGLACDIGAFEFAPAPVNRTLPAISGSSAVGSVLSCSSGEWSNPPLSYAYGWLRDGVSAGVAGPSYTVGSLDAGHVISCRVAATNTAATTTADSAGLTVPAAVLFLPAAGPPPPAKLGGLRIAPSTLHAASSGASAKAARAKAKKVTTGATVRFRLSRAATVRFTVRHRVAGARQGTGKKARCVAPTKRNRKAARCTRALAVHGSFSVSAKAGADSFHFSGRVGGHKLGAGSYTLVATPAGGVAVPANLRVTP